MKLAVYGQEKSFIQIQVKEVLPGKKIIVNIQNTSNQAMHIWQYKSNSCGWGNWIFEFFQNNKITIYVRKPDEIFTLNIPLSLEIPASGSVEQSFDLNDGSWVSHQIPLYSIYPTEEERKHFADGSFAILSIPTSAPAKEQLIWTGTIISPFKNDK